MTDEVARMNRKTICSIVFSCAALAAFGAAAQSQQGGGIKQDAKAVGHGVANGARDVGHATRDVTKKIGHGAKEAGTGIGHGAKKAGVAVGHGAKEGWDATKHAVKHGALKLRDGKLTVAWQVEDVSAAPLLKIAWEEMASTAYTPGSHGYGTGLIDTTIASLGGVVQREHKDGFFVVRFTIPLGGEPRRH